MLSWHPGPEDSAGTRCTVLQRLVWLHSRSATVGAARSAQYPVIQWLVTASGLGGAEASQMPPAPPAGDACKNGTGSLEP